MRAPGASTSTLAASGTNSFMAGGTFAPATTLWCEPRRKLANYDVTLLSCEGSTSEFLDMKPQARIDNVTNYANSGGRVFMSHLHFILAAEEPDVRRHGDVHRHRHAAHRERLGRAQPDDQPDLPQGNGAGAVARRAGRHGQPDAGARITVAGLEHSVTAVTAPTTEWIYLRPTPETRRCGDRCST